MELGKIFSWVLSTFYRVRWDAFGEVAWQALRRESEWEYLDNTKHFIFWLCMITCNMKQLKFGHFNTNSKKFTLTVNYSFSRKKQKQLQKANIISLRISRSFGYFPTIPDYFKRFPKTTEDSRRLPKISEDYRICLKTATAPLSTGSKFMTDFVTYFPKAHKNWQC